MAISQEDVQRVLREYVADHCDLNSNTAHHLVALAVSAAGEITLRGNLFPEAADDAFPEVRALAHMYSWLDPTVQIIQRPDGFNASERLRFRYFVNWLDDMVDAKEYGYQTKEKLLHELKESEAYRIAFYWEFEFERDLKERAKSLTYIDADRGIVEYEDEDRIESDYADEYVRDA